LNGIKTKQNLILSKSSMLLFSFDLAICDVDFGLLRKKLFSEVKPVPAAKLVVVAASVDKCSMWQIRINELAHISKIKSERGSRICE
jgi:hypothetical protein